MNNQKLTFEGRNHREKLKPCRHGQLFYCWDCLCEAIWKVERNRKDLA